MSVVQRRKHSRRSFEADINLVADECDEKLMGRCFNISRGGVLVKFDPVPKLGSRVTLQINFPNLPKTSEIPCTVRWRNVRDDTAGLEFKHLHPMEVWSLNRLIKQLEHIE